MPVSGSKSKQSRFRTCISDHKNTAFQAVGWVDWEGMRSGMREGKRVRVGFRSSSTDFWSSEPK